MEQLTKKKFLDRVFNYEEKTEWEYQGDIPCVIDFHDDACPPCQAIAPALREMAESFGARVRFYKVDTQQESTLTQELGVDNLPTLVLCPMGERPVVLQGAASKEKIKAAIEKELIGEEE